MKYIARISSNSSKCSHGIATIKEDTPVLLSSIGGPDSLQIVEEGGSFYLLYINKMGDTEADTWHASLEDAMGQAEFEFGVTKVDWKVTE